MSSLEEEDDYAQTGRGRYYVDQQLRIVCFNCGQRGHLREACPEPVPCFYCGSRSHQASKCISGACYNCFRPGHNKADCPKAKIGFAQCSRCKLSGHQESTCPDMWRSFLRRKNVQKLRVQKVYCYNCGDDDHFGDDCRRSRAQAPLRLPTDSFSSFVSDQTLIRAGYKGRNIDLAQQEPFITQQEPFITQQEPYTSRYKVQQQFTETYIDRYSPYQQPQQNSYQPRYQSRYSTMSNHATNNHGYDAASGRGQSQRHTSQYKSRYQGGYKQNRN